MADKTLFAGLTRLDPGESFALDGYSFQAINPFIIDRLLKVGAKTHRHNAADGLYNPDDPPTAVLTDSGALPADTTIVMGYTLVDADRGETLMAPTVSLTTEAAMEAPEMTPDYTIDSVGGHMVAGSYTYAITLTDPSGETPAGPSMPVDIDPGTDTNQILFTGLSDIVAATPGATGWRMYKATAVGRLTFIAAGGATLDELTDDGTLCPDCTTEPPQTSTTRVSQGMEFTVPLFYNNQQEDTAVAFRIYAGIDGDFSTPSFVEERPFSDLDAPITYESLVTNPGAPPDTNTSMGGAMKIDPDTELVDYHWKRPVMFESDLPEPAENGDVRVVTNDGSWWTYLNFEWVRATLPAAYWQAPVQALEDLPTTGNTQGDVRLVLGEAALYYWLTGDPDGTWEPLTAAGGGNGGNGGTGGGSGVANVEFDSTGMLLLGQYQGIHWKNAAGEEIAALYLMENVEELLWRDDTYDTDDDPAYGYEGYYNGGVLKTESGVLIPNASFNTSGQNLVYVDTSNQGAAEFYFRLTLIVEPLTNNWRTMEAVLGEGDRGFMAGWDKTDSQAARQNAFRFRMYETDPWSEVDHAANSLLTVGYKKSVILTMTDTDDGTDDLNVHVLYYNTDSFTTDTQKNFRLPDMMIPIREQLATGDSNFFFRPGLRLSAPTLADFRIHEFKIEMRATVYELGAGVKGATAGSWKDSILVSGRPTP